MMRIGAMLTRERFFEKLKLLSNRWWLFYGLSVGMFLLVAVYFLTAKLTLDDQTIVYAAIFYRLGYWHLDWIIFVGLIAGASLFAVKKHSIWYGIGLFCLPFVISVA